MFSIIRKVTIFTFTILIAASAFSQSINDSLIAHYTFNGNAMDQSGNGYHAVVNGATLTADRFGNVNMAYDFDGIDDWINTKTSFDFEDRTVSVWVNADDMSGSTDSTENVILDQNSSDLTYGMLKLKFRDNDLMLRSGGEAGFYTYSGPSVNTWYHIVVTRSASTVKYYLNNILLGSSTSGTAGSVTAKNDTLVIGTGRYTTRQFFDGTIDDLRIYNRVLSTQEIDSLYNMPSPTTSLRENSQNDFSFDVYPNPSNGSFTFKASAPGTVLLTDVTGKAMQQFTVRKNETVRIEEYSSGVYFLKFTHQQQSITRKVLVE